MSKKDYIAIANVIKDIRYITALDTYNTKFDLIDDITKRLAILFEIDNSQFSQSRFINYIKSEKRTPDIRDIA